MPADLAIVADLENLAARASLPARVPPELLAGLDDALVNFDPPTYRACYEKYRIADHGVSYSAFYYYARRIRILASRLRVRALDDADRQDLRTLLPDLLAERLAEALADPESSPGVISKLTRAWQVAAQTTGGIARLGVDLAAAREHAADTPTVEILRGVRRLTRLQTEITHEKLSPLLNRLNPASSDPASAAPAGPATYPPPAMPPAPPGDDRAAAGTVPS